LVRRRRRRRLERHHVINAQRASPVPVSLTPASKSWPRAGQ
jgi:hypothetical protein